MLQSSKVYFADVNWSFAMAVLIGFLIMVSDRFFFFFTLIAKLSLTPGFVSKPTSRNS